MERKKRKIELGYDILRLFLEFRQKKYQIQLRRVVYPLPVLVNFQFLIGFLDSDDTKLFVILENNTKKIDLKICSTSSSMLINVV